jgi:lipopolysaccharide export system permease protein
MMLFQRRLLYELLRNTLTTLLLLTLVLILIMSAQVVQRTEGLTLELFARSLPIFAAAQLDLTLPIAVLVAVVLTYGRAAADNEIDTLRASGVHPLHVVTPGLLFGGLMGLLLLADMDYVRPWAERAKRRILKDGDFTGLLRNKLSVGEPVELDKGTIISAEDFDEQGRALRMRVQIYDDDGDLERELVARTAELRLNRETSMLEVTLRDFETVKGPTFSGTEWTITRALPRGIALLRESALTTAQLLAWLQRDEERRWGIDEAEARLQVHMRLAASTASLLFVLLGLPVALMFRRNDRTGAFLVAFLLALFLYYPSREISMALTRQEALPPLLASWSGNLFLFVISLVLLWRVFRR